MARKLCNVCDTRRPSANCSGMCEPCFEEGSWENEHNDNDHEGEAAGTDVTEGCWICHPELNLAKRPARVGHTNTATKGPHRSHKACGHPLTPAARAACRKAGGPRTTEEWKEIHVTERHLQHTVVENARTAGCPFC